MIANFKPLCGSLYVALLFIIVSVATFFGINTLILPIYTFIYSDTYDIRTGCLLNNSTMCDLQCHGVNKCYLMTFYVWAVVEILVVVALVLDFKHYLRKQEITVLPDDINYQP